MKPYLATAPVSVNNLTSRINHLSTPTIPKIKTKTEEQSSRTTSQPVVVSIPKQMKRD